MHVVRRITWVGLVACTLAACMHEFDAFEPRGGVILHGDDGGVGLPDGGDPRDSGAADGGDRDGNAPLADSGPCMAQLACTAAAGTCLSTCLATETTCLAGCSNNGCRNRCNSDQMTCASACVRSCLTCTANAACALVCAVAIDGG